MACHRQRTRQGKIVRDKEARTGNWSNRLRLFHHSELIPTRKVCNLRYLTPPNITGHSVLSVIPIFRTWILSEARIADRGAFASLKKIYGARQTENGVHQLNWRINVLEACRRRTDIAAEPERQCHVGELLTSIRRVKEKLEKGRGFSRKAGFP